jgi:hypothetical protein
VEVREARLHGALVGVPPVRLEEPLTGSDPPHEGDGGIEEEEPARIPQIARGVAPAAVPASASAPIRKPRRPLPTSPMKILAGGQFQTRNPPAAAAT